MLLRPLKPQDAPLMLEWMHDADIVRDLHRDFSALTIEDCESFISDSLVSENDLHLAITDDSSLNPDEYLGTVSLKHIDFTTLSAEFGITIRRNAMGSGIAHEAMQQILAKAASDYDLKYVYWCVSSPNTRALRFYDKHGYTRVRPDENTRLFDHIQEQGYYDLSDIENYVWYTVEL